MAAPGTAYVEDPDLGTDPQPKHMDDFYDGPDDYGGVHINSGIPNHAFFRVATALGGKAWEKAGRIWYETLRKLSAKSEFQEAAETTAEVAGTAYDSATAKVVRDAWAAVGIKVPFTDIRWFLKKLVDGRKAKPQPHAARVIVWLRAPARVKIIAASILFPMRCHSPGCVRSNYSAFENPEKFSAILVKRPFYVLQSRSVNERVF
jgi:Thermolysin metallopeptidase, alpha-helical domain